MEFRVCSQIEPGMVVLDDFLEHGLEGGLGQVRVGRGMRDGGRAEFGRKKGQIAIEGRLL